ncbi:hypothetical protein PVIIG_05261 [Plasmodium vivax India VII]|uniref:Uncharacterized protein n=1 Tax=Plasmodium vivax India VII TaxID=1077284 RepID=A0A0J9SK16_PLAVI|nr:hypothetical protein PVIIG_05261 [Plasmodium vivax India VII]
MNETIKKLEKSWPIINRNHKIFSEFTRFLTQNHNFYMYGSTVSCTYINFWLNNQDKNVYSSEFESKFNVFRNFATEFDTEINKQSYHKSSCGNYIQKLVHEKYHKQQILYNLYDLYNEHKTPTKHQTINQLCDIISLIVRESYNAKNYIEEDEKFSNILKELKLLIQREKPYKEKCNNYNALDFMLPYEISPPKVEAKETERDGLITVESSKKGQHTHLDQGTDVRDNDNKSILLETDNPPQEVKLQEEMSPLATEETSEVTNEEQLEVLTPEKEKLEVLMPEKEQLHATLSHGEQAYTTRLSKEQLNTLWEQGTTFPREESVSLDQKVYPREDTNTIRGNTGGIFGTIGDSVINVLGEVDPVPVVGVSGGMGALFLLFRVSNIFKLIIISLHYF